MKIFIFFLLTICFALSMHGQNLEITADSVVYQNLRSGTAYATIADYDSFDINIFPFDDEKFIPAAIKISGDSGVYLVLSFYLPERLYSSDSGYGWIDMNFDNQSARSEGYEFFNPLNPYDFRLDDDGSSTFFLGGNPSVNNNASFLAGEYIGYGHIIVKDTMGLNDSVQIDIRFSASIKQCKYIVRAYDVDYGSLLPGTNYNTIATYNAPNILPYNGVEEFNPGQIEISGPPQQSIQVIFNLPERLYTTDSSHGYIDMNYNAFSCAWISDDNEIFLNPSETLNVFLNGDGETSLNLGGNPSTSIEVLQGETYSGHGMITIRDTTGLCVDTQLVIQYSATISSAPLSVSVDSVVYRNLISGSSYIVIAQDSVDGKNIIPGDHNELFTPATVRLTGTPNSEVTVYFVLPANLSPSDGIGAITMNYDSNNCNWVDENADSARFFNPLNPFNLFLDSGGNALLRIGGNPTVSSIITGNEFLGVGLITVEYAGPSTAKSTSGTSADNQAEILFRAINTMAGIQSNDFLPKYFVLHQNYPNPYNPSTTIHYELPKASFITLRVYNLIGQEVATLVNEKREAGRYEVPLNGAGLPSGVFFCVMQSGDFIDMIKLIVIK